MAGQVVCVSNVLYLLFGSNQINFKLRHYLHLVSSYNGNYFSRICYQQPYL